MFVGRQNQTSETSVALSWDAPTGAPAGTTYAIWRTEHDYFRPYSENTRYPNYVNRIRQNLSQTSFIDLTAEPNKTYYYRVTAVAAGADSGPTGTASASTIPAPAPLVDVDLFEDVDGDGVHDNTAAAEQVEATQPTTLPLVSDEQPAKLAIVIDDATATTSIAFEYDETQLTLFFDEAQAQPIGSGETVTLATLGLSGDGTGTLYAAAAAEGPLSTGLTIHASNAAAFGGYDSYCAFLGGMIGATTDQHETWGITAYLPSVPGDPLATLPDAQEESPGLRMRANTDNLVQDLVQVVLTPMPGVTNYVLSRTTQNINVWADSAMTTPLLGNGSGAQTTVALTSGQSVWLEYRSDGQDTAETFLSLTTAPTDPTSQPTTDRVKIEPSKVLVILISGHTQNGGNDNNGNTGDNDPEIDCSIRFLSDKLKKDGFNNRLEFSEDPGNTKDFAFNATDAGHCGATYTTIMDAIRKQFAPSNRNKPEAVALIGYSHGGGLAYLVAKRMQTENLGVPVAFTCYLDAIKNPIEPYPGDFGPAFPLGEDRLPPATTYHINYYQADRTSATSHATQWSSHHSTGWRQSKCHQGAEGLGRHE